MRTWWLLLDVGAVLLILGMFGLGVLAGGRKVYVFTGAGLVVGVLLVAVVPVWLASVSLRA